MNLLTATALTVVRDGRELLQAADLTLTAGELHVLLGANGAGKSTLLRALAGEWPLVAGEIRLAGQPLAQLDVLAQARVRAVLPQHDALAFAFTVRELVLLGRYAAADQRAAHQDQIIAEVLAATDTSHLASRRYLQLSGGERRRAQLARVLAQVWDQPQALLLLDEPTHSLDLAHQHSVLALLQGLAARGFAVLASLHEINLAAAYAHRISLLQSGRIFASGSPGQVLDQHTLQTLYGEGLQFTAVSQAEGTQWLTARRSREAAGGG